ncbi:MAG: peptidyl-prolyl cis-trans isomerase [Myxococcota bacterium]
MIAMLWLWLLASAGAAEMVDGVACVVNDEVITLSEVYDSAGDYVTKQCGPVTTGERSTCTDSAEKEVAQTLIMQALVRQKLSEVDQDITEADLDRSINQIMRENGIESREAFKSALIREGYTWDVYRQQLKDQVRMLRFRELFLRPQIQISEDELQDAYRRAAREQTGQDQLDLTYLVYPMDPAAGDMGALTLKAELVEAVAAVTAGTAAFESLGAIAGAEPQRANSTYQPDQLVEELKPVMQLQAGEVGGPYRLGNSYFVIRLNRKISGTPPPFEQVRDQLEQQLAEQRLSDEAEQWYLHARRSAAVRCTFGTPE